jgi:hypothetical protein
MYVYSDHQISEKIQNRLIGPDNRLNGLISETALVRGLKLVKQKLEKENINLKA